MSAITRPPVVTILGHVDHGKTSLLDKIRKSNVQAKEVGGITQSIGAYQINYNGRPITFIDTPGHAAFSAMRARGGHVADVAVLVVAADDGVMPQTKESIEHIKSAQIPYVVAINKTDLPDANITMVKTSLAEAGEYLEGFGGNVPFVEISAKNGTGIDTLLETILLLADLEELPDTSADPLTAVVVESQLHPQKGPLASLLVQSGTLRNKDELFQNSQKIGKVRSLISDGGKVVESVGPSGPVQVLGFTTVPAIGEVITTVSENKDRVVTRIANPIANAADAAIKIILKTDVAGSLEAILGSLPAGVFVLNSGVGGVTESDVQLAEANTAEIICFNTKAMGSALKLAKVENVTISTFNIIYELFEYLADAVKRDNKSKEPVVTGQAKVLKIFNHNGQTIYGCEVIMGKFKIGDTFMGSSIASLRIARDNVKEVKKGEECGIVFEPALDIKIGEVIMSHNS